MGIDVEERRRRILSIIINSHLNSGHPVSSRAIGSRYRLGLCSASIRNIMADLEELGLITHLHTSAGRVPTDKGYRFYVDSILGDVYLTREEQSEISREFVSRQLALEEIIRKTSKVLSEFTHYTGMVSRPGLKKSTFKKIQLALLEPRKIYVIFITNTGMTRSMIITLENRLDQERLRKIENFMNSELSGTPVTQLKTKLRHMMIQEQHAFFYILKQAAELIDVSTLNDDENRIYFEGIGNMLSFPEFGDSERIRAFAKLLDESEALAQIIHELLHEVRKEHNVRVFIGQENPHNYMRDCSLVIGTYRIEEQIVGGLGVIGPRRMDYGRAIAAVNYVSELLSDLLTRNSI